MNLKIKFNVIVLALLTTFSITAQTLNRKQTLKTIVQNRTISLNGGANASFGGKSRTIIPIVLPVNTTSWYYSFSTSTGISGLQLFAQLSSLAASPLGITKNAINSIKVPEGNSGLDVFLFDQKSSDLFIQKVDLNGGSYSYLREGLVTNTNQAVVSINNALHGTYYLGLRNPSTFTGIHITIEVVAVVQDIEKQSEEQSEAISLGNLGWKAFEREDYDKCIALSNQALQLDSTLGYVYFNIALCHLMKSETSKAISEYVKAIALTKKTSIPKQTFQGAIDDLNTYMFKIPLNEDAKDILDLINQEIRNY